MHTGEGLPILAPTWAQHLAHTLAQSAAQGQKSLAPYLIAVGILIVIVVLAGLALMVIRGRLYGGDDQADLAAGGVLETMRAMRDRGEISEEEYRTAQAAIVAKAASAKVAEKDENSDTDLPAKAPPVRAQTRAPLPGEIRAKPGFDLTGEPLPPPVPGRDDPAEPGSP